MNQPYESYKPSGIEWLDEIPSHWVVKKLRYEIDFLTDYTANGSFADLAKNVEYLEEGYSRLVRLTDLRENLHNSGLYVSESAHRYLSKSELYGGEILLANVGAYSGLAWKMPFIEGKATLAPNMFMLRFKPTMNEDFAYYILISEYLHGQLKNKAISSAQPKLNKEDVRSTVMILPSLPEQRAIAAYLDRKTAQIDDLVARKEQLLALLQQKRQAIINEAVTRGLDLNAPKKDSGIEWLGEIPAHWEVKKLKYIVNSTLGGGTPDTTNESFWNGNIPWVSPKDMKLPIISTTQDYVTELAIQSSTTNLIPPDSVMVVVRSGILKHTFPVAINAVPVTMNQDMKAFVPNELITSVYMALLFKGFQTHILNHCTKIGATVDSIETDWLYKFSFPLPSLQEQEQIVNYLTAQNKKIDQAVTDIKTQLAYFKTYRQSLISEVVTGKMDVRSKVTADEQV